ncbi:hypothetical protein RB601_001780 [Gaeumannomyces tritici]
MDLNGCVNDALAVREYLMNTMKMDPKNIKLLLAPAKAEAREYKHELPASYEEPTYVNIVRALAKVPTYAKRNDLVFVHYSGHGGRATTVFPDLKHKTGDDIDHCLVPTDIRRSNGRYLRDIELGALLQDIVAAGAVLTVVLDCCYSGGAIRGDDDSGDDEDMANVRGEERIYKSDEVVDTQLAPASTESITRWGSVPLWMEAPKGFVLLAACLDYQKAKEKKQTIQGRNGAGKSQKLWHGRLTYELLDTLRASAPGLSSTAIYDRLRAKVQNRVAEQTPYLVGDSDRFFFGPAYRARVYAVPVKFVEKDNKQLNLDGGRFHGVQLGAEYWILPLDFELHKHIRAEDVLARVKILEVQSGVSTAEILTSPTPKSGIEEGCLAVLLSLPLTAQATVCFVAADNNQRRWFEDLWNKQTKSRNLLQLLKQDDLEADPVFTVTAKNGRFQVRDRQGALAGAMADVLRPLRCPDADDAELLRPLARRLEHIARYHMLRGLENKGWQAGAAGDLVDVHIAPSPPDLSLPPSLRAAESMVPALDGAYEVPEKRVFRITLTNRGDKPIACTILNFTPELGIEIIYPMEERATYMVIPGFKKRYQDFHVSIPKALRQTGSGEAETGNIATVNPERKIMDDLFKVLVSRPELDPGPMRLTKLQKAEEKGYNYRGEEDDEKDASSLNTLEELLSALMPLMRNGHAIESSRGMDDDPVEWQVKDIYIRALRSR